MFMLIIFHLDLSGMATSIDVVQNIIRNIQEETKVQNW